MQHFQSLFEQVSESVLLLDQQGRLLFANPAAWVLYGYSGEQMLQHNLQDLIAGKSDGTPSAGVAQRLHRRKDGTVFPVEIAMSPLTYRGETVFLIIVQDMTHSHSSDWAIADNALHYRLLFEAMTEGVCVRELLFDVSGQPVNYRTLDVNPSFESIMQISREQAIGSLGDELYGAQQPYFLEQYAKVAMTGEPDRFQAYFPPRDKYLDISVFCYEPGRFVTVFRDVTETVLAQREVAKSNQRNESLVKVLIHDALQEENLLEYVLEQVLHLTDSQYGCLINYGTNGLPALRVWSQSVRQVWDPPSMPEDDRRSVGEDLQRTVLLNDASQAQTPFSEGPLHITNYLAIPMTDQGQTVFTVFLANKPGGFDQTDIWQITILLESTRQIIGRRRTEQRLVEERELLRSTIGALSEAVIATDTTGIVTLLNREAERLTGWQAQEAVGRHINDVFRTIEEDTRRPCTPVEQLLQDGAIDMVRLSGCILCSRDGKEYAISGGIAAVHRADGALSFVAAFEDVTQERSKQRAITYLSYHDSLTGLYNRRFFEEELMRLDVKRNLPLCVIMGDVNGLKLTNDVFGHMAGDELLRCAAKTLRSVFRKDDIIARWGGDEFIVLLPRTTQEDAEALIGRMKTAAAGRKVGLIELSISMGSYTKTTEELPLGIVMSRAEDAMYRNKTEEAQHRNDQLADQLLEELFRRSPWEADHSRRVCDLSVRIATALSLPPIRIEEIRQIARLHDVGKIVLSTEILNKREALTEEDWKEVRRHPEVGYHIVKANREMAWMADTILHHHERLDGSGYPRQLSGDGIPLLSRIIAVADSFDSMCRSPYGRRLPYGEALTELRSLTGALYDSEVVDVFARCVFPQLGR